MNMKKVKDIYFGLCVFWLLFVSTMYSISIVMNGVKNIADYDLNGLALFMTIAAVWSVILRYPVKIWAKNLITMMKKDMKKKKKEKDQRQNQEQVKAA